VSELAFRTVRPSDDAGLAAIIQAGMAEFGICGAGPGTDPELASISEAYAGPRAVYFVALQDGALLGGGGIGPIAGEPPDVCEVRKMYLRPEGRGHGAGGRLLELCLDAAREIGYRRCHLATLHSMHAARHLYARAGFRQLDHEVPGSGYLGCDTWYSLEL
jgi:putative acetyltransferase